MGQPWDNLPFERQETTSWAPGPGDSLAGAVVVMAIATDVPGAGKTPGLVFRFVDGDNEFMPAVVLLLDDQAIGNLVPLISDAVAAARQACKS